MCDHEGQPCPGKSCRCVCMNCLGGGESPSLSPVLLIYPAASDGRHRTVHAEVRKTGETLGAYGFDHKEGWISDGTNYSGAYTDWLSAVKKLARGGKRWPNHR